MVETKWVTGVMTLLIGLVTPFITGRGAALHDSTSHSIIFNYSISIYKIFVITIIDITVMIHHDCMIMILIVLLYMNDKITMILVQSIVVIFMI